jgi:hypothetical protein
MADNIDINVYETTEEVSINVTTEIVEVNVNRVVSEGAVSSVNGQTGDVTIAVSDNNYTTTEKNKLAGIASGAEINVNADWNATSGDAQILNKPTIPTIIGDMFKSTYDVDNTGVVDNAEAIKIIGRNSTGSTLYRGTVVYLNGATGNRPNFAKAQANAEATSAGTFGIIVDDLANNTDGYCIALGYLDNLDTRTTATNPFTTDTLSAGDTLYLSPTNAGYITNVKPSAPNHLVYVGKVTRTGSTNGTIVYRIQNGYELEELHNVAITSVADKQLLSYDSATSLWKNKSVTTADIADSTNKRYVTDANLTTISNQSGTNTGDETTSTIKSKLGITTLSGSNTGDQDLSGLALKSMGAYSMRVNNTNATANATETNYQAIGKSAYSSTITWTGTTAPSGTTNHTYDWQRVGNIVFYSISLVYATQGISLTAVQMAMPSDMPNPIKPDGLTSASNVLYEAIGKLGASESNVSTGAVEAVLRSNSANTGFEFYITQVATSAKVVRISGHYFTA